MFSVYGKIFKALKSTFCFVYKFHDVEDKGYLTNCENMVFSINNAVAMTNCSKRVSNNTLSESLHEYL